MFIYHKMSSLKVFLFDNGVSLHKSEQTEEKIKHMVIHLIENNNLDVSGKVKIWYNKHRTFDINIICDDMLNEMINYMSLEDLENFCKTVKKYQLYGKKLLSKRVLQEHGIYLLEKPANYQQWVDIYNRSKIASYKTDKLLNVLNHEKEQGTYDPWLFLATGHKNESKFNLRYDIRKKIVKYNNMDYDFFNLILNINTKCVHYKYIKDGIKLKSIFYCTEVYDTLYRCFYYSDDTYVIWDVNDVGFEKSDILDELPRLKHDIRKKALLRLEFIENY